MRGKRFILAGNFIDGTGADVRRSVLLTVKEGIITAIGSAADLPRDAGDAVDDFSHCTVLPALVDCSVSLVRSPSVDGGVRLSLEEAAPEKKTVMLTRHVRYCYDHGVLGVADCDDSAGLLKQYHQEKNLIEIRSSGRDFLRISYSADIENEQAPHGLLSHEDLVRILRRKGDTKAVVVANGPQQVAEALAAGCDAIEQGYGMGEDNLRKMADGKVLWMPGVLRAKNGLDGAGGGGDVACRFSTRYVAPGRPVPGAEAFWKQRLAEQLAQLGLAREWGVQTAVGTGAGSVGILHGESMAEEMKLFVRAGYSLVEAVRCASENGARFFGMEKPGALTVGRNATFLITRGTASQLPRKLSFLEGIYIDGAPAGLNRRV